MVEENDGRVQTVEDSSVYFEGLIDEMLGLVVDTADDIVVVETSKEKKCLVCGVVKSSTGNLNSHIASMHTAKDEPFGCQKDWCKRNFSTLWEMTMHRKRCEWCCLGCGHKISRNGRVRGHQRKCHGSQ